MTRSNEEKIKVFNGYKDKWTKICLDISTVDHDIVEKQLMTVYKGFDLELPKKVVWLPSPKACVDRYVEECRKEGDKKERSELVNDAKNGFQFGNHDAPWMYVYDYLLQEEHIKECEPLKPLLDLSKNCHWFIGADKMAFMSERPLSQWIITDPLRFSRDLEPAIRYADDFKAYYLNGVLMTKEMIETPAEELDPKLVVKTSNVEQRQELVKKIGLERLVTKLGGQTIEEMSGTDLYKKHRILNYVQQGDVMVKPKNDQGQVEMKEVEYSELTPVFRERLEQMHYKLVNLKINKDDYRPYLQMTNASHPEEPHVEGVNPNIRTIFEAIKFRNQAEGLPENLT